MESKELIIRDGKKNRSNRVPMGITHNGDGDRDKFGPHGNRRKVGTKLKCPNIYKYII